MCFVDRPASSFSDSKPNNIQRRRSKSIDSSSTCCDCFKSSNNARNSLQLSDIYCPVTDHALNNSPACLSTITRSKPGMGRNLLNVENEIEYSKNFHKKLVLKKRKRKQETKKEFYEIATEAGDDDLSEIMEGIKLAILNDSDIKVNGIEEFPDLSKMSDDNNNPSSVQNESKFSTLPTTKKSKQKRLIAIPQRITPDGTNIFYICDLPKKIRKGLIKIIIFI